ncbi:MAG TPA: hypothetical protein VNW92_18680, partial [Polyangiaceae bacterium]|nr:hypothetical protein [Polyangiaceae bacterium]
LANGDSKSLQIPALKPMPKPASAQPAPAIASRRPDASPASLTPNGASTLPVSDAGQAAPNGRRTMAFVTGALGIVGLGVGSYFGVRAISKNSDAESFCPRGDKCDDQRGVDLTNQAKSAAVASNITMAIGAAFVVAGVVLYLTSEPERAARLELHPLLNRELAGLGLGGAFR